MKWYLKVLKQYADFSGRARRTEYWMFALFNMLIVFSLVLISVIIGGILGGGDGAATGSTAGLVLYSIYAIFVFIPALAVVVRRLHDTGKGGGWVFITFVPLIGSLWFLVLMIQDGESGSNRFGANPKELSIESPY
ncbi:MAG: DUF805 domain-containing protein [Tannerella sp.]|jgi:uncharacterized membrane protein YhaH (DUF805 family)|nr:DUF805 domain-containing protein [Tannerella sp.]